MSQGTPDSTGGRAPRVSWNPPGLGNSAPCEQGHEITVRYKGFRILTRSYQTHLSRLWTVDLEIHRNRRKKAFSLDEHYFTQREADERCIVVGRQIIDRKFAGWSVQSLRGGAARRWFHHAWTRVNARVSALLELVLLVIALLIGAMALSGALMSRTLLQFARSLGHY